MRRVFRPMLGLRVFGWFVIAGAVAFSLVVLVVGIATRQAVADRIGAVLGAVFLALVGLVVFRVCAARMVASERGVEVVNYLSRRRYLWNEIDRFEVGFAYFGITLVPRAGRPIKVNAIQKSNLYEWLGRRGRADRVVEELNALLAEHRGPAVPPPPPASPPPPPRADLPGSP